MIENWIIDAANGRPMPDGLPLAEQCAYQGIAFLYARFRILDVDKEQAAKEKDAIKRKMKQEIDRYNYMDNLAYYHERVLRSSEAAKAKCRKEPTKENAINLCDTLDGLKEFKGFLGVDQTETGFACSNCGYEFDKSQTERHPNFCERCGCKLLWR